MTSSELPEGYETCPHCEGCKSVLYEGKYTVPCRLCGTTGMVDWITRVIHKPLSNREKPMRYLEQIKKRDAFRKTMKERIKNDKSKSKR